MQFDSNLPIYTQIINLLKTQIAAGKLSGGDKLPSVRELAKELKVNPNTIQRSYQELEREGLVFTQRGMGTFVTQEQTKMQALKKSLALEVVNNFVTNMHKLGFNNKEIFTMIAELVGEEKK
ncbi:MAG: GntR family transcriptional regulator [Firmicutes bacterium]|nr:GntR family transcriptional regulator [Bacillota bacterium]NLZ93045.1 GntR family transcriptional regulator [Bacillota bacterium]